MVVERQRIVEKILDKASDRAFSEWRASVTALIAGTGALAAGLFKVCIDLDSYDQIDLLLLIAALLFLIASMIGVYSRFLRSEGYAQEVDGFGKERQLLAEGVDDFSAIKQAEIELKTQSDKTRAKVSILIRLSASLAALGLVLSFGWLVLHMYCK